MAADVLFSNPIGWAQYKLLGGSRRVLGVCGIYAGALLFFNILIYRGVARLENVSVTSFADGSLVVTLLIQALLLLVVGAGAIKKAVHRDFTTDIISSHRGTAMSGYTAVLGYLSGPNANVLALSAVNLFACIVLAPMAGHPMLGPLEVFLLTGCMAALIWTLAALLALSTRGATSIAGLIVIVVISCNLSVPSIYPGLMLLMGDPSLSMIRGTASTGMMDPMLAVSMIAQVVLATLFFAAAARKYTRDDVPAFSPQLAYVLVAVISVISAAALQETPTTTALLAPIFEQPRVHFVATLLALAMVSILPVINAAKASAAWSRRRAVDPVLTGPRPRPFVEAPIIATLLVFAILAAVCGRAARDVLVWEAPDTAQRMAAIITAFLLTLLSIGGLVRAGYTISQKAGWLLFAFLIFSWGLPPLADLALEVVNDWPADSPRSMLFGCSPVGCWIIALTDVDGPLWPGLAAQSILAAACLLLARRAKY